MADNWQIIDRTLWVKEDLVHFSSGDYPQAKRGSVARGFGTFRVVRYNDRISNEFYVKFRQTEPRDRLISKITVNYALDGKRIREEYVQCSVAGFSWFQPSAVDLENDNGALLEKLSPIRRSDALLDFIVFNYLEFTQRVQ